jgi:hypothetical protein
VGERIRATFSRRGTIILLALLLSVFASVGAFAASGHSPGQKKEHPSAGRSDETKDESEEPDGGIVARFHGNDQASCALPAGAEALGGNWNHGSYVSAWAKAFASGDEVATATIGSVRDAAHSSCGKPTKSLGHGKSAEHP